MATHSETSLGRRLLTGRFSYDFVGRRKGYYIASVVILIVAAAALLLRGLELGIEFRGGAEFQAPAKVTAQTVDEVREALGNSGVPDLEDSTITTIGEDTVRVQTRPLDQETEVPKVRAVVAETVQANPKDVANSIIGPTWGGQVAKQALIALVVFLALVALLIAIYFRNWKMSLAAILALFHDVIVTVGLYALIGFTVTPASVIGLLTILGYSLYDTVVVYDKVRENTKDLAPGAPEYAERANLSINQVIVRSINTTLTGVLPVAALLFIGLPGPLKDLGLVLLIGMIAGAYSSLFLATPMLVDLRRNESSHVTAIESDDDAKPENAKKREKVAVAFDEEGAALRLTPTTADEDMDEGPAEDASTGRQDAASTVTEQRKQPRHRPRSKRKR